MTHELPQDTSSMRAYDGPASPEGAGTCAGLVLLYSPFYTSIDPAYLFHRETLVIGRDPACDIVLNTGSVSRKHAQVKFDQDKWTIENAGSRNGVFVGGQRVEHAVLENMQEVHIGDAIFKFVTHGAERYVDHRIDGVIQDETAEEARARAGRTAVGGQQIERLLAIAENVAKSHITVILSGENGTGKEVFARHIHEVSRRRGPFQPVNCAAIATGIVESELFGCKKGAFSGADSDRLGLVRAADKGTLFLDEIGDMPLEAQAKLLRVLQFREVVPVGASAPVPVDIRIVCATHQDLPALVDDGKFRRDLFGRLNECTIEIPPLRRRKEDIYLLCRATLAAMGRSDLKLTMPFMKALLAYDFPSNVRELEAMIRLGATLCTSAALTTEHLPDALHPPERVAVAVAPPTQWRRPAPSKEPPPTVTSEELTLRASLAKHQGNISAVARDLGCARVSIHRKMKAYGIGRKKAS